MSKRLLSELFPRFVKKSQTQQLSKGPFGEGLGEEELDKARVYLKPGEQAPEGVNLQTGPKGGQYYDEMGGGGAAAGPDDQAPQQTYESVPEDMADRQQTAVDEMQQINQQRMAEYQDAQAAGPEALADWQAGEASRQEGVAAARADIEGLRDARAQGPEAEEAYKDKRKQEESAKYQEMVAQVQADLPNKVIEDGPLKGMTYGEADKQLKEFADKVDMDVAENRQKLERLTEILSGQTKEERQEGMDAVMADIEARRAQNESESAEQGFGVGTDNKYQPTGYEKNPPFDHSPSGVADTGDPLYDNFPGERNERGYLEDVSEPVFANGGVQLPGSDPWAVSEIISDGVDPETLSLLTNEYEKESGAEVPGILVGYTGPLDMDSFNQYASDQTQYEDAFVGEQDMYDAEDFLDWLGSKAETETQKMVKMMQKHNVDNTRRDPIVLSNKGGSQRR